MAGEYSRNQRVAELVRRELALLIQREAPAADLGLVTVSHVDLSPDLKNARVYFTCLESALTEEAVADLLNERAGRFRRLLAKALPLRAAPALRFLFDRSIAQADRLSVLIDSANRKE